VPVPHPPDPAAGVFETLLVVAGRPVELDAHLARLRASCEALYGAALPASAVELAREGAAGLDLGRLRLTAVPAGAGGTDLAVAATAAAVDPAVVFPAGADAVELRSLLLPDGLGAHKWVDRRALEGIGDPGAALLVDDGDAVLEAGNANVFALGDGALLTPPLDGRILPGIARGATIELARAAGVEVREERLPRDRLAAAAEAFLTNSVRGVQPLRSLDGGPLPPPGAVSRLLGAGLRRRWRLAGAPAAAPSPAAAPPPGPPAG